MLPLTDKSRDKLLKESRLLYQKLNKQIKAIDKAKKTPLLRDASERFKDFKKDFRYNDFSKYTDKMLVSLNRDLNYIDKLKSSTLEGAKEALEVYGTTKDFLETLSEDKQDEFWDIYKAIYKAIPSKTFDYKYEIFNYMTTMYGKAVDADTIIEQMKDILKTAYEESELRTDKEKNDYVKLILDSFTEDEYDEYDDYMIY